MAELTYWEARRRALFRELDANDDIVLLGGMIARPFNRDDGLLERYKDRILWPPISEFATAGMAVGAAMSGLRPLVAVGASSFIFYAWAPIANEAPNVRYLSGGSASAPAVFHVMAGARRASGAQHEHTPQAMLQNVPGLRILAPGTPADVDIALHAAFAGDDPVLLIDHVLLEDHLGEVEPDPDPAALRPTLVREGADVLLVGHSLMTQRALGAARALEAHGVDAAVLNLHTLAPAPVADVLSAVSGFPVVVFVDEARGPGSPSSHLMARMLEEGLHRPARLVSTLMAPSPFATSLLDEVVPTVERIVSETVALLVTAGRDPA